MDTVVGNGTGDIFILPDKSLSKGVCIFHITSSGDPFIEHLLKGGVSIWFHTPSAERAYQNRVHLAYPSVFLRSNISNRGCRHGGKGHDFLPKTSDSLDVSSRDRFKISQLSQLRRTGCRDKMEI